MRKPQSPTPRKKTPVKPQVVFTRKVDIKVNLDVAPTVKAACLGLCLIIAVTALLWQGNLLASGFLSILLGMKWR